MGQSELAEVARQIARDQLGDGIQAIVPIVGLGKINAVFRIDCGDRRFVLRIQPTAAEEGNYAKEAWCLARAAEAGVPVPRVRALGKSGAYSFIAEDFIAASPASATELDPLLLWRCLGAWASRFNRIAVSGYGDRMSAQSPGVFLESWEDWSSGLQARAFRDDFWTEAGIFTSAQVEVLKTNLARCGRVAAPGGLVHTDLGEWNTLVGARGVDDLYIIDWEFAVAAPVPHYQLAIAWRNAPSVEAYDAFACGYGVNRTTLDGMREEVTALIVLELLCGVRWAQDHRPQDLPEQSESTRRLVHHLYADRLQ